MELFKKFFNNLFYPFFIGLIITISYVIVIVNINTFNVIDLKTSKNIISIEKKYSSVNINTVTILLLNDLSKIQLGMQQQILFYNDLASKCKNSNFNNIHIQDYIYNYYELKNMNLTEINLNNSIKDKIRNITDIYSLWFVDQYTTEQNLTNKNTLLYKHLLLYSYLIQSIYCFWSSISEILTAIHFYFESSNLYISFPYNQSIVLDNNTNPPWCTDENGDLYTIFRFKCYYIYELIKLTEDSIFDINNLDQTNRKIFIFNTNRNVSNYYDENYVMCIKFNDIISNSDAYICADINSKKLFNSLEDFNRLLKGSFIITSIGFKNMFFYPLFYKRHYNSLSELIYTWTKPFYLKEKIDFIKNIQRRLTSNYYKKIDIEEIKKNPMKLFNSLKINDFNDYFYLNGEKIYYEIYPILLENYEKKYEHVLSVIHLYNKTLYYENMQSYHNYTKHDIVFQVIIFSLFGIFILYAIILSMKALAKYIVIPIKNVQYMIKGINVGGVNRIEYLNYLKQKQEDNILQLKKSYEIEVINDENNNFLKQITNITTTNLNSNIENITQNYDTKTRDISNSMINKEKEDNYEKDNNITTKLKRDTTDILIERENREILHKLNKNEIGNNSTNILNFEEQFDKGCQKIENELSFYDFNEEFLQYRPLEINQLEKSLLDLKNSLLLTSKDNKPDKIIEYSKSEEIFRNFKNNGGIKICQSNIGNLLSQLHKYNEAIYHLVLSINSPYLKKYLSKSIKDEYDEKDLLLNLIDQTYNKNNKSEYKNKLVEKQQNNSHTTFSQKEIHKYINERYNKLVFIYFKFFSMIKKSSNIYDELNGLFLHKYYHTINYYHKILIQYIFLCFASSDLIKIGESMLDYIEFLIKFKLKAHESNRRIENKLKDINNIDYFDKIVSWFNLMDNYIDFVSERTNLANDKIILDNYSNKFSNNDNIYNYLNDSSFLFKINMQRTDFLKGKFAMACQHYDDAIFFLIRAAKKKSIVSDGLIKKKALRRLNDILLKMQKFINLKENDLPIKDVFSNTKHLLEVINKNILAKKREESSNDNSIIDGNENEIDNEYNEKSTKNKNNNILFSNGIKLIINEINKDIEECNIKQLKDVLFIIDRTFCDDLMLKSFIEEIKIIIQTNINKKDRLGLVLLDKQYYIICPINIKKNIDISSLFNDLNSKINKKNGLNVEKITFFGEQDKMSNFFFERKVSIKSGKESNLKDFEEEEEELEEDEENSQESNVYESKDNKQNIIKVLGFLKFFIHYSMMKENENNERYIIFFSNIFNEMKNNFLVINEEFEKIHDDSLNLLIVGKLKKYIMDIKRAKQIINNVLLRNLGTKSEFVEFENIKKIKTILSSNSSVVDDLIFPNEIYK